MSEPVKDAELASDDDTGMVDSPTAASLCKFKYPPGLPWSVKFPPVIPTFAFPPSIPIPSIPIGINCSLKNPLSLTADLPNGGGRKGKADPDPEE